MYKNLKAIFPLNFGLFAGAVFLLLSPFAPVSAKAEVDASSIGPSWEKKIGDELKADYFRDLQEFVKKERKTKKVYPSQDEVFTAYQLTPFEDVKVVIIGQDPYPSAGMAHGLAFSIKPDVKKIPASLKNIFKELKTDLPEVPEPTNGYLGPWAKQGVLMINTVLTVVEGQPNSHAKKGWEQFTDATIDALINKSSRKIIFVLWGKFAQKRAKMISESNRGHIIIEAAHPSPLSAKMFFGSRPFSKINEELRKIGEKQINWSLADSQSAASGEGVNRTVAAEAELEWHLGGYLPSDPNKKVYLKVKGRKIVDLVAAPPRGSVTLLDTDSFIFPGMIDMHNHMESNYLGLWKNAKGQYLNRFEWRAKKEYVLAVKNNDAAFDDSKEGTCAAFRWAEFKALVGGVTAIQGMGSRAKCVSDFGINNIEVTGEFGNRAEIRSNLELVNARNVGHVFMPKIAPLMKQGLSYEKAFEKMMQNEGVSGWVDNFKKLPRNLASGLLLTIGDSLKASVKADPATELNRLKPEIEAYITDPKGKLKMSAVAAKSYWTALNVFLLGDDKNKPYIDKAPATEDMAYDFLGKAANVQISGGVKRYVTMFELGLKAGALNALKTGKASAYITHLAEGMRKDVYNRQEFTIAKDMGLVTKGMIFIHGVGMQPEDFRHAAKKDLNITVVWSPFSNLLLYGETLDVVSAKKNGVRLAFGSDWSPTGSKSLLDELKIARRYLDKAASESSGDEKKVFQSFSDQELVEMATVNASEALGVGNLVGKVDVGYQADLTLVSRGVLSRVKDSRKTPYSALVQAEHADVNLVVVKGQPLFGDKELVSQFAEEAGDRRKVETLPNSKRFKSSTCKFEKAIRFPFTSALDSELGSSRNLRSVSEVESLLVGLLDANGKKIKSRNKSEEIENIATLDSIFSCEDPSSEYGKRFANFVEKEVTVNQSGRRDMRVLQKLSDDFNPLKTPDDAEQN